VILGATLHRLHGRGELISALGFLLMLQAAPVSAAAFDPQEAMRLSQGVIGRPVADVEFATTRGERLRLSELAGRPVIVSMIYTSCLHVCAPTTAELRRAVREARATLGPNSFAMLSIGFDARNDTPERMASFARELKIDDPGWYFASASAADIARLSKGLGFMYAPAAGGFDHLVQTTILDERGRVYRQIYGQSFRGATLIDPLRRIRIGSSPAIEGAPSMLERVRLLCTVFDPKSGRYRFDYSLALAGVLGVLFVLTAALFIGRHWRVLVRPR
jgi:protein SCO1